MEVLLTASYRTKVVEFVYSLDMDTSELVGGGLLEPIVEEAVRRMDLGGRVDERVSLVLPEGRVRSRGQKLIVRRVSYL